MNKFEYEDNEEDQNVQKVSYPKVSLFDGHEYEGEWNTITNERHGRGYLVWNDGSVYEGYWLHDRANGKGRLIQTDGDVYLGYW